MSILSTIGKQLPVNCEAFYCQDFLSKEVADALYAELLRDYDLTNTQCEMGDGTVREVENGVFLFVDEGLTSYDAFHPVWGGRAVWPDSLRGVRDRLAALLGIYFHVARSVYYKDGKHGMAFHQDLPAYGPTDAIASLSLGAERGFAFRSVTDPEDRLEMTLHHGSLLFMGEHCQDRYEHSLLTREASEEPRINLTFRKYVRR